MNSLAVRTSAIECFCDRSVRRIASRKVPNLEGAKCRKPVLLRTGFPVPCEATGGIGRDEGLTDSLGGGVSTQLQQPKCGIYLTRVACKGVWLLPAFGLLLALSTIRQQPPVQTDFEGYARFVTTGEFLVSHLVASIGGAALAILGVCSGFVLLAGGRSAVPR